MSYCQYDVGTLISLECEGQYSAKVYWPVYISKNDPLLYLGKDKEGTERYFHLKSKQTIPFSYKIGKVIEQK